MAFLFLLNVVTKYVFEDVTHYVDSLNCYFPTNYYKISSTKKDLLDNPYHSLVTTPSTIYLFNVSKFLTDPVVIDFTFYIPWPSLIISSGGKSSVHWTRSHYDELAWKVIAVAGRIPQLFWRTRRRCCTGEISFFYLLYATFIYNKSYDIEIINEHNWNWIHLTSSIIIIIKTKIRAKFEVKQNIEIDSRINRIEIFWWK